MAIQLNDNIKFNVGKPADSKYLNGLTPYTGTSQAASIIPISERYSGLTINVNGIEYWWNEGLGDGDITIKNPDTSGSGERIEKIFNQTAHGFAFGEIVAWSGSSFISAIANGTQQFDIVGIVTEVIDINNFRVVFSGYIDGITSLGLTADTTYYLSPTVAGLLTPTAPVTIGHLLKPIIHTMTADDGVVFQFEGEILSTGSTPSAVTGVTEIVNVGGGAGEVFSGQTQTVSGITASFRTLTSNTGITITTSGDTVILDVTGTTTAIGAARDGSYDDGLFDFDTTTPTGYAIDDINEVLAAIAPNQPPALSGHTTSGTFSSGKLSWGATKDDIGYEDVGTIAGNSAVDINGTYTASGNRKGLTQNTITGILNDDVVGDVSGAPYLPNAFRNGDSGTLAFELNGSIVDTLSLSGTTAATTSTYMSVSAQIAVKFDNGNDFNNFKYRTGTYSVAAVNFQNGFNYLRIHHTGATFSAVTAYNEWVYDSNSDAITGTSETFSEINISGSKYLSGVEYSTGGSATYSVDISNAYKNVYSSSVDAVSFPSRTNLDTESVITITGTGVTTGTTTSLPALLTGVTNPQNTNINILATLPFSNNIIIGSLPSTGTISSNVRVLHPFTSKSYTGSQANATEFLVYNVAQSPDNENEDFTGEALRLEARDYSVLTYANINSGVYAWDSTEHLISGNTQHNTGLLVINGELMYPSASYLTTTYGIVNGDFSSMSNALGGNPDYSTASGIRSFYRRFKSNNTTTQSTITFEITHTGNETDFITSGGTSGTASGNNIKFEFVIKRSGGSTHGWANPFASTGNPEGIANTNVNTSGGVTTVSATLSTVPRIGNNDIIVVRVFASASWSNEITNIEITNI